MNLRKVGDTMPNLTKTIKLRLNVTEEQVMLFCQMTERYRQGCNFVSQYIFAHAFPLAFTKLSKTLYLSCGKCLL